MKLARFEALNQKLRNNYEELEVVLEKQIADNKLLEEEKAAKAERVQSCLEEAFDDCKEQAERANDATLQVSSEKMLSQELRKRYEVAVATLLIASHALFVHCLIRCFSLLHSCLIHCPD